MAYNLKAALEGGYTESEIAEAIAQEKGLNIAAAREGGYTDREILAELTKPTPGLVETAYRGLRRSVGELGVLGGDILPALAASAVLPEEKAKPFVERQIREAATTRAELEAQFPTVYKSYKDVEGLGSGLGYVSERFGELLPDILPSIFSGGVGYAAGKKIAKEAAEEAAQKMFAKKEREMIESGVAGDMTSLEIKNIAAPFSRKAAEELTNKYARTGLGVGTFLGSYAQNAPEVFENIYQETGDIAPAGALLFGGLSAMLDSYLPVKILDDLGGFGKAQIMSKMLKDSGANPAVWKSVLKEGGKAAVGEGLTESAQEAISVAAEKFYGSNKEFFAPENVERYLESFFAGAAGGGVLGGVGGVGRGLQEKAAKRDIDALFQPPAPPPEDKTTVTTPITPAGGPPPAGAQAVPAGPPTVLDSSKLDTIGFKSGLNSKTYASLLGLDMTKSEDVAKAQEVINDVFNKKYIKDAQRQRILEVVNSAIQEAGGTPIVIQPKQAAAGVGAGVPGKPGTTTTPEGAPTPSSGGVDVSDRGVAGSEAGAVPSVNTLEDRKKAIQDEIAAAKKARAKTKKGLAIGDQGVFRKPELGPEGAQLVALEEEIRGVRERYLAALQRVDDATNPKEKEVSQEAAAKLEEQLSGLYDQYGALTDKLTKPKTPVQEATGAFTYMPGAVTTEQPGAPTRAEAEVDPELAALEAELRRIEAETEQIRFDRKLQEDYETVREDFNKVREEDLEGLTEPEKAAARKALPKWSELSIDGRMVFEDALEYYESIPEALQELVSYLQAKGGARKTKNTTAANYVINRAAESRARGIEFPRWNALSEEERKTFTDTVKAEENRLNTEEGVETLPESDRRYKGPDYRAQQAGFNSLGNILAAKQKSATEAQAAVETENRRLAEARGLTAEQRKEADELSLNQPLPENIVEAVKAGDLQTVLDYLSKEAKGLPTGLVERAFGQIVPVINKTSSQINCLVAGSLSAVLSGGKIKLVYDESLTTPARYEPKANTIRVGPRGLNETAILHEATHAATVRVIFVFLDPKTRNQLSKEQQEAVAHLLRLMQRTRPSLEGKYKRAYKDVYEFVAYAMTDPKFQADLKNIELKPEERLTKYSNLLQQEFPEAGVFGPGMGNDTAYESFTRAVANALGLVTKFARYVKNLFSYNPYFKKTEQTQKDIDEQVADLTEELINEERKKQEDKELTDKEQKRQEARIKKEIVQELKDSDEAAEAQAALNKARQAYKRVANKFKDQTKEELNNNAEYLSASENYTKAQAAVNTIKNRMPDLTNLGVTATREQGYLGNVMVEIAGAFDQIISAPPDGGITNWDNKPLFISAGAPTGMKAQEIEERLHKRLEQTNSSVLSKVGSAIASIFTKKGYDNLVRKVQDRTIAFRRLRNLLRMRGQLKVIGGIDEYNDVDTAINTGTALAQNYMNKFVPMTNEATDLMQSLMKSMGLNYTQLLAKLHTYMIGLQEPERRHTLFLRNVPLTDDAATARQKIYEEVAGPFRKKVLAAKQANNQAQLDQLKQEAEKLRKDLEDIVFDKNIISGTTNRKYPNEANFNDEFSDKHNALGYDYSEVQYFKQEYDKARQKQPEIDELFKVLQQIMDQTQVYNEDTNYFSVGAQSVIWFYGWKSYFPFIGKPDPSGKLQMIEAVNNPYSDKIGGDFAQGRNGFMGRLSDSDNPVLQIFTEATRSTLRKGYFMAPHAMKNLINTGRVAGKKVKTITFEQRYDFKFNLQDEIKQNDFLVYQPDGSIDVYEINDPDILRAFKGLFTPDQPLIDAANKLTSAVGQTHTRYNPAFAPLDFTRNLVTYAGIVGLKYGPTAAVQMITAISRIVAEGGMHKTFMYTKAYGEGNEAKLKQLLGKDPDNFYKDIDTYYQLGGPVAYVAGLTSTQSQTELAKKLGRKKVAGMTVDDATNFFDSWIGMFETTTRIAAFRVVKEQLRAQGITNEDELNQRAMAEAKELANFQKVGELGKALGAAFMFWRPAATGAIVAIDAVLPAFDTRTEEQLFKYYKEEAGAGETTDEEARAAVKQHMLERRNARYMGYALIGAGMLTYLMAYMLAGEDEEERNKVATDDMARWVRFLRINTGLEVNGRDLVLQMSWGFGPGAFASAGAQIMATAMGNQSFMSMANNIMDAGFESFVPLPISKIDKFANPSAAAVDSLTPSVLRPFLQYAMNTDGLGRRIYSDRQSRYGDAFLGSDNVPALFTDIARGIFDLTGGAVDWSPSTLYFFANNYVDGASRAVATTYNISQIMVGNKNFDPRTDTFFLDSYLKAPSNYDAIQFSKVENKIKEIEKTLNSIKGTPAYADYLADNPMDQRIVDFYNKTVNGRLRELRAQANKIRRSPDLTTQERQDSLQLLIKQQNQIKSAFTTAMAGINEDFASFGYED